jgi:hypothetical protein
MLLTEVKSSKSEIGLGITGNKNQLINTMTTKQNPCFTNLRTPSKQSTSCFERREMDLKAGYDVLQEPGQTRLICLEALLWISAVVGWSAIAYLCHMNPSFG